MILYHGTSEWAALEVIEHGLKPRGQGGLSNWEHTVESNPDAVYLTSTYACHFALHAMHNHPRLPDKTKRIRKRIAVIEIETANLTQNKLHPDEDALEQAGRKYDNIAGNMVERTRYYRTIARRNPNWEASLEALGTCTYYGPIARRHFRRIAFFEPKSNRQMQMMMMDGQVGVMAFQTCGWMHQAYTRWLFDPTVKPEDIDLWIGGMTKGGAAEFTDVNLREMYEQRKEALQEVLNNRSGIEVITVNNGY